MNQLLGVLIGMCVAIWWWPNSFAPSKKSVASKQNYQDVVIALSAELSIATDFDTALFSVTGMKSESWFAQQDHRANRLRQVQKLSRDSGMSGADLMSFIVESERASQSARHTWYEKSAAARTASLLLLVLPLGLWAMAQAVGVDAAGWLFGSDLGRICIAVGALLNVLSRLLIKTIAAPFVKNQDKPHQPLSSARSMPSIDANAAAITFAIGAISFLPGVIGLALGVLVFVGTREAWPTLRSGRLHSIDTQIQSERPWVAVVIAANLDSGADWLTAVRVAMISSSGAIRQELEKIVARLHWGVEPNVAFNSAHELLQPLSQTIQRSSETGSPLHAALLNQASVWTENFNTSRIQKIETVAERLIIPVTLLQLPAFFVLGVVPMVAAEIFPMLETFSSTEISFS
jgi:hypothetical protein